MLALAALGLAGAYAAPAAALDVRDAPGDISPTAAMKVRPDIVKMIGDALEEVRLRPDQATTVGKLYDQVKPLQDQAESLKVTLLDMLADQVKAGHVDDETLEPTLEAAAVARTTLIKGIRSTLVQLHLILDDQQRSDFADALECKLHELVMAHSMAKHLEDLSNELSLDDVQKREVKDVLDQVVTVHQAALRDLHQILEAFRGADFSLEQIMPERDILPKSRARVEMFVEAAESITDVLDTAQREKYAEHLRKLARPEGTATGTQRRH
jgi:hypothetical protein